MAYDLYDWETARASALGFLEHMEQVAAASLAKGSKFFSKEDRERLAHAREHIRSAFVELDKWFVAPRCEEKPSLAEHGYMELWSLISAAFIIGSRGTVSETASAFLKTKHGGPGGIERGKDITAAADKRWRIVAKQKGEDILKVAPRLSIEVVMTRVMHDCPDVKFPEPDTVYSYLRKVLPSKAKRKQELIKKNRTQRARRP